MMFVVYYELDNSYRRTEVTKGALPETIREIFRAGGYITSVIPYA